MTASIVPSPEAFSGRTQWTLSSGEWPQQSSPMLVGVGGKTAPASSSLRWENSKMRVLHSVLEVGCFPCILPEFPRTTSLRKPLEVSILVSGSASGGANEQKCRSEFSSDSNSWMNTLGSWAQAVGSPPSLCVTPRSRTTASFLPLVQWTLSRHSGHHPRGWYPNPP